jgi:hypothetical protein
LGVTVADSSGGYFSFTRSATGENKMKNAILRSIVGATLTMLAIVALGQVSVNAQRGEYEKKIWGSWDGVTTRRNCQTGAVLGTFPTMFTFSNDGTFWEAGTNIAPSLRTVSHGLWERDSPGVYTTSFRFFRFNADGTLAGRNIVRQHIEVSNDGQTYTASATNQAYDINGVLLSTSCATGEATRFE